MKKIFDFILDSTVVVIIFFFVLFTLPFMLYLLFPKVILLSKLVLIAPDPRHILLLWLVSMTMLSIFKKLINTSYMIIDPVLTRSYRYLYAILSLMLSIYFFVSYSAIGKLSYVLIALPILLYGVVALTHSLSSYLHGRLQLIVTGHESKNLQYWKIHKKRYFLAMVIFWIVLPSLSIGMYLAYFPRIVHFLEPLVKKMVISKRSSHIDEIVPTLGYPSSTIIIKGDGFGWLQNKKDSSNKLYIGDRYLYPDSWTDKEVLATLPLDLKPGKYNILIQTRVEYNGKIYSVKSNIGTFTVLSRTDGWDKLDDLYFQQINSLGLEDKEIK